MSGRAEDPVVAVVAGDRHRLAVARQPRVLCRHRSAGEEHRHQGGDSDHREFAVPVHDSHPSPAMVRRPLPVNLVGPLSDGKG